MMNRHFFKLQLCGLLSLFIFSGMKAMAAATGDSIAAHSVSEVTSEATVLRQSWQVIQRKKDDLAACYILLPEPLAKASSVFIAGENEKSPWRRELKLDNGGETASRGVLLENLPTG